MIMLRVFVFLLGDLARLMQKVGEKVSDFYRSAEKRVEKACCTTIDNGLTRIPSASNQLKETLVFVGASAFFGA